MRDLFAGRRGGKQYTIQIAEALWRICTKIGKPICTLHDTIERGRYPYRCGRCGECLICRHHRSGYTHWICLDGQHVPAHPKYHPGVPI